MTMRFPKLRASMGRVGYVGDVEVYDPDEDAITRRKRAKDVVEDKALDVPQDEKLIRRRRRKGKR